MSEDNFMHQQPGSVEVGYFDKRKKKFHQELAKGLKSKAPRQRVIILKEGSKKDGKQKNSSVR